jgi:DNA-binding NarL/FixJ family response regulator
MIKILVADDHGLIRRGIAGILSGEPDMRIEAEAASGEEALLLARERKFEIAILDINMPGRGGLDVVKDIRLACPGIKVIMLSMYSEEQYAVRSLKNGASAYLTKDKAEFELVPAIRQVAGGHRYITKAVAERLAYYVECDTELLPHERLGTREYEVLVLLGSGLRVVETAKRLNLSSKTVSTYRSRLLAKMGLSTNAQLVKYVIDHKLS